MDESRIIPYYAHPHVYTRIIDNTYYTEDTAMADNNDALPFATCVVTGADKGIDNTFIRVSDLGTKKALFGKGDFKKYGQSSIQADLLFSGSTDVWFCRVLPDNATYSNLVVLALYRKGNESVNNAASAMKRLEIKFRTVACDKNSFATTDPSNPVLGATDVDELLQFAYTAADAINSPTSADPDAVAGYKAVPLFFVRAIGRGKYGNAYAMSVVRDADAEKDYGVKMYDFRLVENGVISRIINIFAGSLYQTTVSNRSTLISDVVSQFPTGTCPVDIYPFEESLDVLYDFYQAVVTENAAAAGATDEDKANVAAAQAISEQAFDPVFGYVMNTRSGEKIPFYKNYTIKASGAYVAPDAKVAALTNRPADTTAWDALVSGGQATSAAAVGSTIQIDSDANHDGLPYIYTITALRDITGETTKKTIEYDEGVETELDANQYTGEDITVTTGISFKGGNDGDFENITVSHRDETTGELVVSTVTPNSAQMKLLIAREQVKVFHGVKDRRILSPARINLDFIFDANYNSTIDSSDIDGSAEGIVYAGATCLTTADQRLLAAYTGDPLDYSDIDVKQAMYDLVTFRNKNGITQDGDLGAGCHLHLDCGLVGFSSSNVSSELADVIGSFQRFTGRATSIDLGYYDIFDPYTGRRETVTVSYFIAENLVPHLMRYGINKPFTTRFAQLSSIQRNTSYTAPNQMIRDSFKPDIDLIDWDVKEELFTSRINYYISTDEGRIVQRACQNTRQLDASALLEENNVRVLNTLKKGLEAACNNYLYDWNEPATRKGYTDSQMAVYRPWIGSIVQDIDIRFDADEWEQERMIMHCYCVVKFRDIIKRIILQINIERPTYNTEGGE